MNHSTDITTDVLVIGAGGAGMYAAIAAANHDTNVTLIDKNMIGRGGATIMAQMTVAAALAEQTPDSWEEHVADTLNAGRGLCDESLVEQLCQQAPARMREMDDWGVGWARDTDAGHITQVMAPGHRRPRCCYVDFLNTGPQVAQTLRRQISRQSKIRRISDVTITDLVTHDGQIRGALAIEGQHGSPVRITANAVVIATGGLTKLFSRSSASNNMAGDGYALALRAGADLVDMEFVQFFPIGHLAPRLVGMDPIMWDPFRYKLGGRLLNGRQEEFMETYGETDAGTYTAPRDTVTYAIQKENQAGRGSPHGGAWLSFQHISPAKLREAFGPVIDKLAKNGIDLGKQAVEVAPIAHYHMGGLHVDASLETKVRGLFGAGEAIGGASGANRLSGNAISEALVYGNIAGQNAAHFAARHTASDAPRWEIPIDEPRRGCTTDHRSAVSIFHELKALMWDAVGPLRDLENLQSALDRLRSLRKELADLPVPRETVIATELNDWYELRSALLVAESVTLAALSRTESRGAHQREDHSETSEDWSCSQLLSFDNDGLHLRRAKSDS